MAIGNGLLIVLFQQEWNKTNETDEEGKNRDLSMERNKAGTKKKSPDGLSLPT